MSTMRLVIVTRPDDPGRQLTTRLRARGASALWLPVFDLTGAPDPAAARATLATLSQFELAIFVSPTAVRATADLLATDDNAVWPEATAIGAVGRATLEAVRERLHPGGGTRIHAPDSDDEGGSEPLWHALESAPPLAQRALILRAASGREWLADRLAEHGAQVTTLAVYDRRAHVLRTDERARVTVLGEQPVDSVFSSSEAVDAVRSMLTAARSAWGALKRGTAIASHARIAQRLTDAGFTHVVVAPLEAEAILSALGRSGSPQRL